MGRESVGGAGRGTLAGDWARRAGRAEKTQQPRKTRAEEAADGEGVSVRMRAEGWIPALGL